MRLFFLQVVHQSSYSETADKSYVKAADAFNRGIIYFQKKDASRISAATIESVYLLTINPKLIENDEAAYEKLSSVITISEDDFLGKAKKKTDPYEVILDKIKRGEADKIKDLGIKGVYLYKHNSRFYPGESMASQAIGFLGYGAGDTLSGQYGLEKYYNATLSKKEENLYVNVFAEIFSGIKSRLSDDAGREGDILTTIEPTVQDFLEKELLAVKDKYHPEDANGIIINPQNGEIVAMARLPNFDLNNFGDVKNAKTFSNPLVENVYEFGSVIKPLVMASAIDAGVVNSATPFYDKGSVQVEDKTIYNFDKKGRGQITLQEVLSESLNTGMVFTMEKLGRDRFKKYMLSYGLADKTNIDLPNEAKGLLSNLNSPRKLEYATASFGQGISFSPVTLVRALSSLGNGGYLVQPHMVKEIDYSDGGTKKINFPKEEQPKVISDEASRAITKMLVYSVDHVYGEGKYKMENYSIAAKTGTAQIPNPKDGGYFEDRNLHSFVGYFPGNDPQFLVFLSISSPQGVRYAAETLSQPFFDITKFLISYYEIPPDR